MGKFYVRMDNGVFGPYTAKEMMECKLPQDIMVKEASIDKWQPAKNFDFALFVKKEILSEKLKGSSTNVTSEKTTSLELKRLVLKLKLLKMRLCIKETLSSNENLIFNDDKIKSAICEVTNPQVTKDDSNVIEDDLKSHFENNVTKNKEKDKIEISEDEYVILSYAQIYLRTKCNYSELKAIFEHINNFEERFPDIANCLQKNMNLDQIWTLKTQLVFTKKRSYVVPIETITIPHTAGLV